MATMAQELIVKDDLNGELGAEPVRFAIDGAEYEIDLADRNSARLRDFLAEFIAASRPVGRDAPVRRRHAPAFDFDPIEVRAWWKKNPAGLPQWRAKGKVPGVVVDAWRAAT